MDCVQNKLCTTRVRSASQEAGWSLKKCCNHQNLLKKQKQANKQTTKPPIPNNKRIQKSSRCEHYWTNLAFCATFLSLHCFSDQHANMSPNPPKLAKHVRAVLQAGLEWEEFPSGLVLMAPTSCSVISEWEEFPSGLVLMAPTSCSVISEWEEFPSGLVLMAPTSCSVISEWEEFPSGLVLMAPTSCSVISEWEEFPSGLVLMAPTSCSVISEWEEFPSGLVLMAPTSCSVISEWEEFPSGLVLMAPTSCSVIRIPVCSQPVKYGLIVPIVFVRILTSLRPAITVTVDWV